MASTYFPEEGSTPLHTVAVARVGGLDFRVERADHIVEHLDSDVISPHTGACTSCVLVSGLKNLKGSKPGRKIPQFNRSDRPSPL
jgi:hypothetical protein